MRTIVIWWWEREGTGEDRRPFKDVPWPEGIVTGTTLPIP